MTPEDRLREAYRALQEPGSERCPPDEELAALALGELDPARRDALADHVTGCRRCSESAGILLETRRETEDLAGTGRARRRWVSLAAAAAAIAALAVLLARDARRPASFERGAPRTSAAAVVPADGADLDAAPARFAWGARPSATAYRLRLFRDSGELAWDSGPLKEPSADLPADGRAALAPGGSYYWVVEVEEPVAKARLGPFSFRIAPPR